LRRAIAAFLFRHRAALCPRSASRYLPLRSHGAFWVNRSFAASDFAWRPPSAMLLAGPRSGAGRSPGAARVRGYEPRPRAPHSRRAFAHPARECADGCSLLRHHPHPACSIIETSRDDALSRARRLEYNPANRGDNMTIFLCAFSPLRPARKTKTPPQAAGFSIREASAIRSPASNPSRRGRRLSSTP